MLFGWVDIGSGEKNEQKEKTKWKIQKICAQFVAMDFPSCAENYKFSWQHTEQRLHNANMFDGNIERTALASRHWKRCEMCARESNDIT